MNVSITMLSHHNHIQLRLLEWCSVGEVVSTLQAYGRRLHPGPAWDVSSSFQFEAIRNEIASWIEDSIRSTPPSGSIKSLHFSLYHSNDKDGYLGCMLDMKGRDNAGSECKDLENATIYNFHKDDLCVHSIYNYHVTMDRFQAIGSIPDDASLAAYTIPLAIFAVCIRDIFADGSYDAALGVPFQVIVYVGWSGDTPLIVRISGNNK